MALPLRQKGKKTQRFFAFGVSLLSLFRREKFLLNAEERKKKDGSATTNLGHKGKS